MEKALKDSAVIIPSLDPDQAFIPYIQSLKECGFENIIIVDDGNAEVCRYYFNQATEAGCTLLRLGINCGKGMAIKLAVNQILVYMPQIERIVITDGDATYLASDVAKVAEAIEPNTITLGCRDFNDPLIQKANRRANTLTRYILQFFGSTVLSDTQTGLRGFGKDLLPYMLGVPGDRYEYDFNMIGYRKEILLKEVPIEATKRNSDKKTHFKPLKDTWTYIATFLKFICTSLSTTILDVVLYTILIGLLIDSFPYLYITIATVLARIVSDIAVYYMDKHVVFKASEISHPERFVMLSIAKMIFSAILVTILVFLFKDGETWIKMFVDTLIFFIGYRFEKNWVYAK